MCPRPLRHLAFRLPSPRRSRWHSRTPSCRATVGDGNWKRPQDAQGSSLRRRGRPAFCLAPTASRRCRPELPSTCCGRLASSRVASRPETNCSMVPSPAPRHTCSSTSQACPTTVSNNLGVRHGLARASLFRACGWSECRFPVVLAGFTCPDTRARVVPSTGVGDRARASGSRTGPRHRCGAGGPRWRGRSRRTGRALGLAMHA
jgi:hypothetical protein